jgi:hypothetical protein
MADRALFAAKNGGRNRVESAARYRAEKGTEPLERMELAGEPLGSED